MRQDVLAEDEWSQLLTSEDDRGLTPLTWAHVAMHGECKPSMNSRLDLGHTSPSAARLACVRAGSRSAVWAPQGGDGQKQVLELSTLPGVENVALAPSQGHQRPRRAARRRRRTTMIERMDHVGIVVYNLAAATEFFVELGLELQGEGPVEGRWVDRVVGLDDVRADIAMMRTRTATAGSS